MNSKHNKLIKLGLWGTGLSLLFVAVVLTLLFIVAGGVRATDLNIKTQPSLPSPIIKTCSTYGYTCASGYSCNLNTTALGTPSPIGSYVPTYACTISTNSCSNGCPSGWKNDGLNVSGGGYKCSPAVTLCKSGMLAFPASGGGYYCYHLLQG